MGQPVTIQEHRMSTRIRKQSRILIPLVVLIAFSPRCESFFPEVFQEGEFAISTLDDRACNYLTRSLYPPTDTLLVIDNQGVLDTIAIADTVNYPGTLVVIETIVLTDTVFKEITISFDSLAAVFDSLISDTVDASEAQINAEFDTLRMELDTLAVDTTLRVKIPPGVSKGYAFYNHAFPDYAVTDVVFFIDDYIDINIINRAGTIIEATSTVIPLELVTGCTVIKTRYVFELDQAPYLVRFILDMGIDSKRAGSFRTALLPAE